MGSAEYYARIHSQDIDALNCYIEYKSDSERIDAIDAWRDVHGPRVDYIVDSHDGAFLGAYILHQPLWTKAIVWTDTSKGRTFCEYDGEIAAIETDCRFLSEFFEREFENRFY